MPRINKERQTDKENFVKLCFDDNIKAAQLLRDKAIGLENCKDDYEKYWAVQDILFLSRDGVYKLRNS